MQVGDDPRQRVRDDRGGEDRDEHAQQQAGEGLQDLPVGHVDGGRPGGRGRLGHRGVPPEGERWGVASGNRMVWLPKATTASGARPIPCAERHGQNVSLNRCISRANSATSSFGQSSRERRIWPSRAARAASNRRVPSSVRLSWAARRSRRVRVAADQAQRLQAADLPAQRALADAQLRGQVGEPDRPASGAARAAARRRSAPGSGGPRGRSPRTAPGRGAAARSVRARLRRLRQRARPRSEGTVDSPSPVSCWRATGRRCPSLVVPSITTSAARPRWRQRGHRVAEVGPGQLPPPHRRPAHPGRAGQRPGRRRPARRPAEPHQRTHRRPAPGCGSASR